MKHKKIIFTLSLMAALVWLPQLGSCSNEDIKETFEDERYAKQKRLEHIEARLEKCPKDSIASYTWEKQMLERKVQNINHGLKLLENEAQK